MSLYQCANRFAWRTIDQKVVILDTSSGDYFTLNETATAVWEELMAGRGPTEAAQRLVSAFDVDSVRATDDVGNLISSFTRDGFLVPAGSN